MLRFAKKANERLMRCRAFLERVGARILLLESVDYFRTSGHFNGRKKKLISKTLMVRLTGLGVQPRPQGFSLKKWIGREKALASAGHVYSLNIPEKLIYMQPAGFALTEGSNNGK